MNDLDNWRREQLEQRLDYLREESKDDDQEKVDRVEILTEAELTQWGDPIVDISPDLPDDTLIRRYVSTSQLLSILEGRRLWLSSVNEFDDDLEGAVTNASRENYEIITEIAQDLKEEMQEDFQKETTHQFHPWSDLPFPSFEDHLENIRRHCLVNCWRIGDGKDSYWESAVFWNAYVPNGTGVAIESTVGKLKKCFEDHVVSEHPNLHNYQGPEAVAGEVSYLDFESDHAPATYPLRLTCKHGGFADEKEYRIIINLFDDELSAKSMRGDDLNPPSGEYMRIDPSSLIDNVYVSPNAPPYLFDSLEGLFDRYCGLSSDSVHHSALTETDPIY